MRTALALGLVLLPLSAGAATLRTSLPSHVPAPRGGASAIRHTSTSRDTNLRATLADRVYTPRRDTSASRALAVRSMRRPRQTVSPEAIYVYDGDTFYVGADAYRLRGIDTPERGQPGAESARRRLIVLLNAGPVTIVPRAEDVYGRVVADVYVSGRDVARALRAEGYGKPRAP